jgi:predicted dehydrogenase
MLTHTCHTEHLPAVESCPLLALRAIYSRSQKSAEKLAQSARQPAEAYFDSPSIKGQSLGDLLDREDIDAVIVALPIPIQPEVIKRAIAAGKHVLSEKPIAKDVETAEELIRWYEEQHCEKLWSVGENFRFFEPLAFGAEQVRKMGGEIMTFNVKMYGLIDEDNEYSKSAWYEHPAKSLFILAGTYLVE